MELKLYIRQAKRFNAQGKEIYLDGNNPGQLQIIQGTLPGHRQLSKYNQYLDVTNDISNLHQLKFTWTHDRNEEGVNVPGQFNHKKAASGTLVFEGQAYQYLKQWLVDDVSAPLNVMDVQVKHAGCGDYLDWVIKATDLKWCEDEVCTFDVTLKQKDAGYECIHKTLIDDDWQGWFGYTRRLRSGKMHPRFSYCAEVRPNGMLITIWWLINQLMPIYAVFAFMMGIIWNSIVGVLIAILSVVKFFKGLLGGDTTDLEKKIDDLKNSIISFDDIKEVTGQFFVESAGCGREHPAPLIRDYIKNVCDKCGITVDHISAPVFFARNIIIETSEDRQYGRPAQERWNPHYNACYLAPVGAKGIRRFDSLNPFKGVARNTTDFWIPENHPVLALDQFLDELKQLYNAEWRIKNNTLYFQRKDFWMDDKYIFDFSKNAADRNLLLQGLCFEWDEVKDPAYIQGLYQPDAADVCGNEALDQMGGIVSVGNAGINPNVEGSLDKRVQFGATRFRLDGAGNDYIYDAMQQVINGSTITGQIWATPFFNTIDGFMQAYADYALLLKQEQTTLPKVIIWDEASGYINAKSIKTYFAADTQGGTLPPVNPRYNNNPATRWPDRHHPHTKVLGRALLGPQPFGYYNVQGPVGIKVVNQPALLINYPMYFEPGYLGTMWDWFHWIDDPNFNPILHQQFTARLELCCDTLKRIKPFGNGKDIVLAQKVKLPLNYQEAYITEITVDYSTETGTGPFIEIKGRG